MLVDRCVVMVLVFAAGAWGQVVNNPTPSGNVGALAVSGQPVPGETVRIDVAGDPGDTVHVFFGFLLNPVVTPFGVLEIDSNAIFPTFVSSLLGPSGTTSIVFTWPAVFPGFAVFTQGLLVKSGGVVILSNSSTMISQAPQALIACTSPVDDETDVALTRETIFNFTRPIDAATVTPAGLFASFAGQALDTSIHVNPEGDKVTLFYDSPLPASALVRVTLDGDIVKDLSGNGVDADGDGSFGGMLEVDFSTVTLTQLPNTSVFGRIFASDVSDGGASVPLDGVTISVDGMTPALTSTTDAMGNFCLDEAPVGTFFVHIDGATATNTPVGFYYPTVGKSWSSVAGQATLIGDIHLPAITTSTLQPVSNVQETPIAIDPAQLATVVDPNLAAALAQVVATVPAGSLFANDGTVGGMVGVAPVAADRLPGTLPPGLVIPIVITVQTNGPTNFDEPVPIVFPNLPDPNTGMTLPPGAKSALWSFNHDAGRFEIVGAMTVSADGLRLETDPGVGILAPGWHGGSPGNQPDANDPRKPDPCQNGFFGSSGAFVNCAVSAIPGNPGCFASAVLANVAAFQSEGPPSIFGVISGLGSILSCVNFFPAVSFTLACAGGLGDAFANCFGPMAPPQGLIFQKNLLQTLDVLNNCVFGAPEWTEFIDPLGGDPRGALGRLEAYLSQLQMAVDPSSPGGEAIDAAETAGLMGLPLPAGFPGAASGALIARLNQTVTNWGQGIFTHTQAGGQTNFLDRTAFTAALAAVAAALQNLAATGNDLIDYQQTIGAAYEQLADLTSTPIATAPANATADPTRVFYLVELPSGVDQRGILNANKRFEFAAWPADAYVKVSYLSDEDFSFGVTALITGAAGETTEIPPVLLGPATGQPDSDGDGLHDIAETIVGTDPGNPDTDGDGVNDGAEIQQGLDPLDGLIVQTGILSSVDTAGTAVDVAAFDSVVAIADSSEGVSILNVFNGMEPVIVALVDTPGTASRVDFTGNLVAVADGPFGLAVIDVSDPPDASIIHQVDLGGSVDAVVTSGPLAYAGLDDGTIAVVDMASGTILGQASLPTGIHDLAIDGQVLCAHRANAFDTLTLDGPIPVPAGTVNVPTGFPTLLSRKRLTVGGGLAYPVHERGYVVVDVSSPLTPVVLTNAPTGQFGWKDLALNGSGLALAAVGPNSTGGNDEVTLYDTSDPNLNDQPLVTYDTPGTAYATAIFNGLGYVADGDSGLQVVNYIAFDSLGIPPTVALGISATAEEGKILRVTAEVSDDVQVRKVEFYLDGQLIASDGSFPFEVAFVTPLLAGQPDFQLRAVAFDTGGNSDSTGDLTITLVPDLTAPVAGNLAPADGSAVPYVSGLSTVVATFNEPLDPATVNANGFSLVEAGGDGVLGTGDDEPVVALSLEFDAFILSAFASFATDLVPGLYQATLATTLIDLAGNALTSPVVWSFTVVDGDADGDGLTDFDELNLHLSDPNSIDSDGDGLTDGFEVLVLGTSPISADTDGDGIDDATENAIGSDPLVGDPLTDIIGTVQDPQGVPVAGVTVHVRQAPVGLVSATTSGDGRFLIEDWPSNISPVTCVAVRVAAASQVETGVSLATQTVPTGNTEVGIIDLAPSPVTAPLLPGRQLLVGDQPARVRYADLDGNGLDDLVVANRGDATVSILSGAGDGSFVSLVVLTVGGAISDLVVADLNGDLVNDIVCAQPGSGSLTVFLGIGGGTFGAPVAVAIGGEPTRLQAGQLDADADVDLAVVDAQGSQVLILSGDGVGGFGAPVAIPVGSDPRALVIADLDGTNGPDLATADGGNTVSVSLNDGNGGFGTADLFATGADPRGLVVDLLDADAFLDLAVVGASTVTTFLGDGTGAFFSSGSVAVGDSPTAIASGDLNADAFTDLVLATETSGDVLVMLGLGGGGFGEPTRFGAGLSGADLLVSDLDGDGLFDALSVDSGSDTLTLLRGRGDGSLESRKGQTLGTGPQSLIARDLNADGVIDLASAQAFGGSVSVSLGLGDGGYLPAMSFAVGLFPEDLVCGDLNSDQIPDLLTADFGSSTLTILYGDGGGGVSATTALPTGNGPRGLALGDLDGNGSVDLVAANSGSNTLTVYLGLGGGAFGGSIEIATGLTPRAVAIGDFDDDGNLDIAAANSGSDDISIVRGLGNGTFDTAFALTAGSQPFDLACADFNGDGRDDLAVVNAGDGDLSLRFGQGGFGLGPASSLPVIESVRSLRIADLDLDGALDLLCLGGATGGLALLRGDGSGGFGPLQRYASPPGERSMDVADRNGDGLPDVVIGYFTSLANTLVP